MNHRVFKNATWMIGCKIIQSLLSFVIGMITARYLGPSNYGLISYAASIVAFFLPIMQLGLNSTLVQEFLQNPDEEGKVLGTSLILNMLAALASVVGVVAFAMVANAGEKETIVVCFLYSLSLVFQASEMSQFWFQSKLLSKYPSIAALVAYIGVSLYKIYILTSGKSIAWFAVTHVIEAAIISILLLAVYKKLGGQKLAFSFSMGKRMFSRSKYYISSGLIMVVFQQTDRIMLKLMLGQAETGYYSAAFTCVGVTAFVFSAIIDSARPSILQGIKESKEQFEKRLTLLFSVITGLALAQSIGMTVLAKQMISVMFGEAYTPSIRVLQITVWYVVFGYYGVVRNIWILAEGKQKYLWRINLAGALINVVGNFLLIPKLGVCGAALTTVLTQFLMNFVLCFSMKFLRPVGKIILRSLNPKSILQLMLITKKRS